MGKNGAMVVDCRPLQEQIKSGIKSECERLNIQPRLAIIKVGDDYASGKYVAQKVKHGEEAGLEVVVLAYPEHVDYETLKYGIAKLNSEPRINGIILQLPLPTHLNKHAQGLIDAIDPIKDVDCLTTINVGKLVHGNPTFTSCTPQGVIDILDNLNVDLTGLRIGIIGRSNIVGKPLIHMLLDKNAQVSVYHSKCDCKNLDMVCDVIISAVGIPKQWTFDWSDDTILIDVGINFDENGKICGDIDLDKSTFKYATPVPNGVGRMTVAALLKNVMKAYKIQNRL